MKNKAPLLIALLVVGLTLVAIGLYSILSPSSQVTKTDPCQPVVYSPNVRWVCGKPSYTVCPNLEQIKSSVKISDNTAVVVVPAHEPNGVSVTGFQIDKGDKISISVDGRIKFSSDHPCVEADGMAGWEDLGVDSPFNRNVGGLEFSIGSLYDNRYFVGKNYQATADVSGIPVFRVIESLQGYRDNNGGAYTVTLQKIK